MEKLSILLVVLFLVLCIGRLYFSEPFAEGDIKNATVTMSLSDLLYYSGSRPPADRDIPERERENVNYYADRQGGDLGSYLYLKNEMSKEFKEKLKASKGGYSFDATNVEPPSCSQGSSYMETVPLKVPASCSQ